MTPAELVAAFVAACRSHGVPVLLLEPVGGVEATVVTLGNALELLCRVGRGEWVAVIDPDGILDPAARDKFAAVGSLLGRKG